MDINTFSSIPTDSLYKFLSLSGIILILASATIPEYFRKIFLFQLIDIRTKHEVDLIESKSLVKLIDELKAKVDTPQDDEKSSSEIHTIELLDINKEINIRSLELRKNYCITEGEVRKIEYLSSRVKIIAIIQKIFMIIGIILTFIGGGFG